MVSKTRSDIELVISADDQAKATLEQFNELVQKVAKGQKKFSEALDGTGESSEKLKSNIASLNQVLTKIGSRSQAIAAFRAQREELRAVSKEYFTTKSALEKTDKALVEAERAVNNYSVSLKSLKKEQSELNSKIAAVDKYRALSKELVDVTGKLNTNKDALARTKKEMVDAGAAVGRLKTKLADLKAQQATLGDQSRAITGYQKLTAQLDALRIKQTKAQEALDKTAAKMGKAQKPSQTLAKTFAAQTKSLTAVNTKFDSLSATVNKAGGQLKEYGIDLSNLVGNQERIAASQAKVTAGIGQATSELNAAKTAYTALGNIQKSQTAAVSKYGSAFTELKADVKSARSELTAYGIGIKNLGATSQELNQQQLSTSRNIDTTTASLKKSTVAQTALQKTQKEQAGSLKSLGANYKRLFGYIKTSIGALRQYGIEVKNLDAEEKRLKATSKGVTDELGRQTAALEKSAAAGKRAGASIRKTGEDSRKSLSYFQRLRGETLSLIATFGGLFAAGRGVASVFEVQRKLDASRARLGVAFEGDDLAIDGELKRVRQEADRLGLSFETLLEEYTKFVPAAKRMGLTLDESRKIFDGVSEAAVVNRLDVQDLQGVYKALGQIISKNQAQAEEIRGQLGDRLVGTVIDYAAALGVTTEEFSKMLEQGEVTARSLVSFSGQLQKVYGPELAGAINQPVAELARLQNALYDIKLQIAQSGFVDELGKGFQEIAVELQDPSTKAGARELGRLLSSLVRVIVKIIQNMDKLALAIKVFISLRIAAKLVDMGSGALSAASGVNTLRAALGFLVKRGALMTGVIGAIAAVIGILATLGLKSATAGSNLDDLRERILGLTGQSGKLRRTQLNTALEGTDKEIEALSKEAAAIEERLNAAANRIKNNAKKTTADKLDEFGLNIAPSSAGKAESLNKDAERLSAIKQEIAEYGELRAAAEKEVAAITETLKNPPKDDEGGTYIGRLGADAEREYKALTSDFENLNKQIAKSEADSLQDRFDLVETAYKERLGRTVALEELLQKRLAQLVAEKPKTKGDFVKVLEKDIARMNEMLGNLGKFQADGEAARLSERRKIQEEYNKKRIAQELKIADFVSATQQELAQQESATLEQRLSFVDRQIDERIAKIKALENASSSKKAKGIGIIEGSRDELKERAKLTFIQDTINNKLAIQAQKIDLVRLNYVNVAEQNEKIKDITEATAPALRELAAQGEALADSLGDEKAVLAFRAISAESGKQAAQKTELIQLQDELNRLQDQQQQRVDVINISFNDIWEKQTAIKEVNEELNPIMAETAQKALEIAIALGDEKAILNLKLLIGQIARMNKELGIGVTSINRMLADGLTNAIADTVTGIKSAGDAFRQFAADFLRRLGEMIIQQTIFNALQTAAGSGGTYGAIAGFLGAAVQHTGGMVGGNNPTRIVPAMAFAGAPRFHNGGMPGFKPDEYPTILQRGEEVLPPSDPRHRDNGGGGQAPINIVNSFDTESVVSQGIATPAGERAILNVIRANKNTLKGL